MEERGQGSEFFNSSLSNARCSLSSVGNENVNSFCSTPEHSGVAPFVDEVSERIIAKKPKAYPVLRRSVESLTFSDSDISPISRFVHTSGRPKISSSLS